MAGLNIVQAGDGSNSNHHNDEKHDLGGKQEKDGPAGKVVHDFFADLLADFR